MAFCMHSLGSTQASEMAKDVLLTTNAYSQQACIQHLHETLDNMFQL